MDINLILAIISFIFIFIFYYLFCIHKKNKIIKKKGNKKVYIMEINYLKYRYGLDEKKLLNNKIIITISLINAFIISGVFYLISFIKLNIVLQLMIGFMLMFGLIYAVYELLGRYLKRKGY